MLFTGTCKNPQVLQFLRNTVWHYSGLDSRATEEPVKDTRGLWCHLQTLLDFQLLTLLECDENLFRNIMSGQIHAHVTHHFTARITF